MAAEDGRLEGRQTRRAGEEPALQRLVSTDPTTEALGPILAKNPRGLIVAPDEMTRWVMSMDQYKNGKGGDRPFYLSTWNGEPIFIDRAKHMREPIVVPHPFLTVMGGMTPDMLSTLPEGQGRDDGFIARLLFAYPDRVTRRYAEDGVPDDVAAEWSGWQRRSGRSTMREVDGKPAPRVVRMDHEAAVEWRAWCQAHYAEQEADEFRDSLEGPWGKLEAYAGRLALILHLMTLMSDPTRPSSDDLPELPKRTIEAAFRLVAYFKAHALRVYAAMGGKCDRGGDDVQSLVRWIRRNNLAEFAEREITRNMRRFRDDPAALEDALGWMANHNIIRPRERPEASPKGGRPHSAVYDVNPQLNGAPQNRNTDKTAVLIPNRQTFWRYWRFCGAPMEWEGPAEMACKPTFRGSGIEWPAIRDRIDLAAVATTLLGPAPKRSGRLLLWLCPFHEDHDPSLQVDPAKRRWKCWPCNLGGDAPALVMRIRGVEFPEAVRWLAAQAGIALPSMGPARPSLVATMRPIAPAGPRTSVTSRAKTLDAVPEQSSGLSPSDALLLVQDASERIWTPEGGDAAGVPRTPRFDRRDHPPASSGMGSEGVVADPGRNSLLASVRHHPALARWRSLDPAQDPTARGSEAQVCRSLPRPSDAFSGPVGRSAR